MATEGPSRGDKPTLTLVGLESGEARPELAVVAVGQDGKVAYTGKVDAEGRFDLPESALKSAHRILLGPAGISPAEAEKTAFARYRPAQFAKMLEAGTIAIARPQWELWRYFFTCVTGTVKVCRRSPWWFEELAVLAKPFRSTLAEASITGRASIAKSLPELIHWPYRCSTICNGTVEVYRRRCCCVPWILDDPRIEDLLRELEVIVKWPPIPWPEPGPDPGPEVGKFIGSGGGTASRFFRDGTLDEMALYAQRDLAMLRSLSRADIPAYINARAYLFCRHYSCGTPVKVADGTINPDGRFNLCFRDWPQPIFPNCHYEYAYIVRQPFGPFQIVVYNGVAANQWFHGDSQADLVTYHALAFACREPGEPGTGAYVYLDVIGDTLSHELHTPVSTGPDRVASATGNDGLVSPSGSPTVVNRNWGGTVKLNYMFSEDLRFIGAEYYRVSIMPADSTGAPTGPPIPWDQGLSWRKAIAGGDIVAVSLGPNPVGTQQALYKIPYDLALPATENWEANQYHVYLDTTDAHWSSPAVRHLVMLEIFDSTGQRLRPNGTAATGLGGAETTAAFTYRRRIAETGPTNNVPHGALTHLFWWDNRDLVAEIAELVQDGVSSDEVCQFLVGTAGSQFGIKYRAYHPEEKFQHMHSITWQQGLNGATGTIPNALPPLNVGVPPLDPQPSGTVSFGTMLGEHPRCAFAVDLEILGKMTDGDDYNQPYLRRTAAFALEIGTP